MDNRVAVRTMRATTAAICAGFFAATLAAAVVTTAGCGGSDTSVSTGSSTGLVAATVVSGPEGVQVAWTPPTLSAGETLVEYNIYRDGAVVGVANSGTTTYSDLSNASTKTLTYQTVNTVGALETTTKTVSVSPVATAASHTYMVTYVIQDNSTGIAKFNEVTLGTTNSVTLA